MPPNTQDTDLLDIDDILSEEEILLRDSVRGFVEDKILPNIASWYEAGRFELDLVKDLANLGIFGMTLDGYGGGGARARAYGIALRELEAGDSGLRSFVSVQSSLTMNGIYMFGSEEQKNEWLPKMASGDALGCFGLTEPDAGSNPAAMKTNAVQKGGDWEINGVKTWITNGSISDVALVWAQTEETNSTGGIRGFLVPTDSKGFSATDISEKASMRASITSEISLNGVLVPDEFRLPEATGLKAALSCLSEARFGICFGAVGAARSCLETAIDYSQTREVFAKPLAALALTQDKLVNMATLYSNAGLVAMHLAALKESGKATPAHISYGKRNNVAAAREIAREARSVLGANGISLAYPPIRHMANLESVYTYEGTHEIHTLVLGQKLTGHSAF